ncbi:histone lysine methyltransferase Set9 [Diatrype stigma]|uniref:Histone-lysine N-methyltransferase SET9 n=1 Tax=Diatrype stigma TaxID=117547 RepID=A0AAN9UJR8_9PEZI
MAPNAKMAAKRQPLTLAQLSTYDDILTDALVDHTFYWTTIPKNRPSYHPSRGIKEEEITKIIQSHLIVEADLETAEAKLLATDGLRKFHQGLKTTKEKDDFRQHLRRYMQIYLPDCPFEVSSTNRYTIVSHEARITARKFIKKGQPVKYLSGIQVLISPKEEDALSARKKDFSIVVSSRNKCASLFMGPARFANHDCGANARLMITSHGGIEIIATQNIEMGDEITVTYGESYFGEDNCECLCKTCEDNLVNGWAQPDGSAAALKKSIESAAGGYSLRRRRRDESSASASRTPSVTPDIRPRIPKSRSKTVRMDSGRASLAGSPGPETLLRQKRKREFESLTTPPVTPAKKQKTMDCAVQAVATPDALFGRSSDEDSINGRSTSESASGDMIITAATTPESDTQEPGLQSPEASPEKLQAPPLKQEDSVTSSLSELAPAPLLIQDQDSITAAPLPTIESPAKFAKIDDTTMTNGVESTISVEPMALPAPATPLANAMEATLRTDDVLPSPNDASIASGTPDRGRARTRGKTREAPQEPLQEDSPQKVTSQRVRMPGDYTLTPVLLSEPDTAWVHCTICNEAFVQHDAYFTRSACPRCERHSKLYGYQWPKTEREGPQDKEERILDHRIVHRFLDPEDELKIRGRKLPRSSSSKPKPTTTTPTPTVAVAVAATEAVVAVTPTATTTTTTTTTDIAPAPQNIEAPIQATIQAQPPVGTEIPVKRGRGRPRKYPQPSTNTTTTTPITNAAAKAIDGDGDYVADRNCATAAAVEAAEREDARRSARRRNPSLRATVC